jgi:nicotinamide riboside transporter PnuC
MRIIQIKNRLIILISLIVGVCVIVWARHSAVQCVDIECVYLLSNGLYKPIVNFVTPLIITISIFIFLPTQYFKNWLIWIASWTLPISLFLIAQESPYSTGGFLKLSGRPFMAEMTGYIVCGVSIIFIIVYFVYTKFLKRKY